MAKGGHYEVGYGKPPKDKGFKKGQVANPLGAGAHNRVAKHIKYSTIEDVAEVGTMILENNFSSLQKLYKDPETNILKMWFASVALHGIKKGDAAALNAVLDRIIGKCKERIEFTGVNGGPVRVAGEDLTAEQRSEEIQRLERARRDLGED